MRGDKTWPYEMDSHVWHSWQLLPPLIDATVAAGLLVLILSVLGRRMGWHSAPTFAALSLAVAVFFVTTLAVRWPRVAESDILNRPIQVRADGYVSSEECRSCHPAEHASWHRSYHRTMTQRATPEAVIPELDGVEVEARGRRYAFERRGDRFWVDMVDPDWRGAEEYAPRVRREIVMTTGSHHEQDFWYETGHGRSVAHLPIVYRIKERRWLPNGATFMQPPPPPGPPGRSEVGGWNRNCLQCHATHGQPRIDPAGADTHVAEFGIACEACHGPAAEHVAQHRDPRNRYAARSTDAADPTIVHPGRLAPNRSAEVCGQCHMVSTVFSAQTDPEWNERGHTYRPGDVLADSRDVVRVKEAATDRLASIVASNPGFLEDRFWSDGMIRVSGREYNGLIETPCFQRGPLSCLSCHVMHQTADDPRAAAEWADDQLGFDKEGDAACLQCHAEIAGAIAAHTYHRESSSGSRCYNCHMPHTTWGLLKAIRSHQVDSPSVQASLATGRPNACNLCHLNETLEWTATHLEGWYGIEPPPLEEDQQTISAAVQWLLRGDAGQRALVAWSFGWAPAKEVARGTAEGEWVVPVLAHLLEDPYDAVRFVAADALRAYAQAGIEDYDFLAEPEERARVRARLVDRWTKALHEREWQTAERVLLRADGRWDEETFTRLAAERDDRRVELRE